MREPHMWGLLPADSTLDMQRSRCMKIYDCRCAHISAQQIAHALFAFEFYGVIAAASPLSPASTDPRTARAASPAPRTGCSAAAMSSAMLSRSCAHIAAWRSRVLLQSDAVLASVGHCHGQVRHAHHGSARLAGLASKETAGRWPLAHVVTCGFASCCCILIDHS